MDFGIAAAVLLASVNALLLILVLAQGVLSEQEFEAAKRKLIA
jgi:hypothetical protein